MFICHPRNHSRNDLSCPFGCQQLHRKCASNERSKSYYQSPEGKEKKKWLNAKRLQKKPKSTTSISPCHDNEIKHPLKVNDSGINHSLPANDTFPLHDSQNSDFKKSLPILKHIRDILFLLEQKKYHLIEIWDAIVPILRQHSIDSWGWNSYTVPRGNDPPF
jgi:hypothetical protein